MTANKNDLTPRQSEVLDFIRREIGDSGRPPTTREICAHFGWTSTTATADHLRAIERKGWIRVDRAKARGIRLLGAQVPPYGLLSPPVWHMALAMQEKLDANAYKGGWSDDGWTELLTRLRNECTELSQEISVSPEGMTSGQLRDRAARIRREAADVANFAMMIADNEGDLDSFGMGRSSQ